MSRRHRENRITMQDAFSNPLFRLGVGSQSPLEATQYPMTRLTQNYALLNSLYRNNWIVQNIITAVPEDMMREWVKLSGITPEAQAQLNATVRRTAMKNKLTDGLCWGRLYGGAVGVMLIRGQEDLSRPLDLDGILPESFAGLYIADRWSGVSPGPDLVTDIGDTDFGLPAFYAVQDANGHVVQQVHHSRVIRFIGRELPYVERIAEMYWGESEIEAVYEEIVKRDNVSHNLAGLTFKACRDYMEVDNLDQLLSMGSPQEQRRFYNMMQAQNILDSNFGMKLVNKGDGVHNTQYTFSGLAEVYGSIMMDVAGASRIPVTKLFGRPPAGLDATGDSDLQNYYDYIDTLRESRLRPILERLLPVLALSCWGEVPDGMEITFPPLWTPKATEVADIADKKSGAVMAAYQSDLLDKGTALKELKGLSDETGLFGGITDGQIRQGAGVMRSDAQKMTDPLAGLLDTSQAGGAALSTGDTAAADFNSNHDPSDGRFTSGGGGGKIGKTKYAPSPQRSESRIQLRPKTYARLTGTLNTRYPGLKAGEKVVVRDANYLYQVTADGFGGMSVERRFSITNGRKK